MRNLAKRLIADETKGNKSSEIKTPEDFYAGGKLRPHLAALMGAGGFRALLSRALALTNTEVTGLRAVQVKADGSLEGTEALPAQLSGVELLEGRVVLLSQVLGLLVAFIGEDLTVRLVRDVWPNATLNDSGMHKETGTNENTK